MSTQNEVDNDKIPKKQKEAKEEIEQTDDYFIKAAREGSEYDAVGYFYSKGSVCEWCGNQPCSHMYVIEHKESGERLSVGSTCIEKITGLGGSYDRHELFQEKVDKLAALKDRSRDEIKKQDVVTIAELNEEIEEEIEEREAEKNRKIEEQRKEIKEKGLDVLKHYNDFCADVLEQSHRRVLSDKQMSSLEDNKGYLLEDYDSVEEFKEAVELNKDLGIIMEALDHKDIINGFWAGNHEHSGHVKPARDFKKQLREGRHLTDNQKGYLYSILQRYKKKVVPAILSEFGKSKLENMHDEVKEEVLFWDSGYVVAYNRFKYTRRSDLRVEREGWSVSLFRESLSEAKEEMDNQLDYDHSWRHEYLVVTPKRFATEDLDEYDEARSSGTVRNMLKKRLKRFDESDSEENHQLRLELVNKQLEKAGEDGMDYDEYIEGVKDGDSDE